MKQLILIGLLGLVPPQCEAVDELRCTCVVQLSLDERIRNSSEIFIAEVVAVSDTARPAPRRSPFPAASRRLAPDVERTSFRTPPRCGSHDGGLVGVA